MISHGYSRVMLVGIVLVVIRYIKNKNYLEQ